MKNQDDQSLNPFVRRSPRNTMNDLGEATNLEDTHDAEEARISGMVPQDATTEAGFQRMLEILGQQSSSQQNSTNPVEPVQPIPTKSPVEARKEAVDTFAAGVNNLAQSVANQNVASPQFNTGFNPQFNATSQGAAFNASQGATFNASQGATFNASQGAAFNPAQNAAQNSPGNPFMVPGSNPMNFGLNQSMPVQNVVPPSPSPAPQPPIAPTTQPVEGAPTPEVAAPEPPKIKDEDVLPLLDSIMTRGYASESFNIRGAHVTLRSQFFWEDQRIIELTDERSRDVTLRATSAFYFQVYALAANLVEFGGNYFKPIAQGDPKALNESFQERVDFLLSLPSIIVSHLFNKRQTFVDKMSYLVDNFDKLVESF